MILLGHPGFPSKFDEPFERPDELGKEVREEGDIPHGKIPSPLKIAYVDGVLEYHTWGIFRDEKGEEYLFALVSVAVGIYPPSSSNRETPIRHFAVTCAPEKLKKKFEEDVKNFFTNDVEPLFFNLNENTNPVNEIKLGVLEKMNELEIEFALSEFQNSNFCDAVVLDGSLRYTNAQRILEVLKKKSFRFLANVKTLHAKPVDFRKISGVEVGRTSKLFSINLMRGTKKYFFFLKVMEDVKNFSEFLPFLRFEFIHRGDVSADVFDFLADFCETVKGAVSLAGNRAPQNLAPVRMLERILRAKIPQKNIFLRKVCKAK